MEKNQERDLTSFDDLTGRKSYCSLFLCTYSLSSFAFLPVRQYARLAYRRIGHLSAAYHPAAHTRDTRADRLLTRDRHEEAEPCIQYPPSQHTVDPEET